MTAQVTERPFSKMVNMTPIHSDQIALESTDLTDALGRIRTARKPWRCVCADPLWGFRIETRSTRQDEFSGFRGSNAKTREEADAEAAALIGKPSNVNMHDGGKPVAWFAETRVVERPNPNHRPDCLGDIAVGDRYFEYLGDSMMWESGSRYCARCAIAVWEGKS